MSPNHGRQPTEMGSRHTGEMLEAFLSKTQLADALGVSERTIDRWVNLRQFPKPAKIGRLILWRRQTVIDHLERLASSDRSDTSRSRRR